MSSSRSIPAGKTLANSTRRPAVDVEELKLAITMQEIADRTADSSRYMHEVVAKQIESGAVIDSPEYEFDQHAKRVRRRRNAEIN